MTIGGRLVSLFPALYLALILGHLGLRLGDFRPVDGVVLLGLVYLLPLGVHRIHACFFPVSEGNWPLAEKRYNPWWASHMFQFPFVALPWLEALLHFVPGLYSAWLRAWGSEIGRNVYWTPRVEVVDRGLIAVGDHVVVGHITAFCSHMVAEVDGAPVLVVKKIRIGERAFIGADTQLGPGAVVPARTKLKPKTRLYWRGEWP
jgi:acetyltransferase-like isoleucine patch superfamily enzyme